MDDNPHREIFEGCEVTYWTGNSACGRDDDWSRATVSSFGGFPNFDVGRSEMTVVSQLVSFARLAFKRGQAARSKAILALLDP